MTHKLNVAVLRGGPSSEYEVSLKTGASILKHMPEKYRAHDILISRDGRWHREGLERDPARALAHMDVVVNAMHGEFGEDGKVQKILDGIGVPYTGSGAIASAIGMNKILSKQAFAHHGIKTPYYAVVTREDNLAEKTKYAFEHFMLPIVVKPASAGSSVGVTIVKAFPELEAALRLALSISESALMEEYIKGKEATCGVADGFRGEKTYTFPPAEIRPHKGDFFNFESKYEDDGADEICPGNFSDAEKAEIQRLAKLVHESLGLRHYSRTDFMIHPRRGIFVLEVNTLPGMTPASLLPKSLAAVGCTYPDFIDHLIQLALAR